DNVDYAVARAEFWVRLTEPGRENTIFGNAIEDAVGTDDGGVDGAGENNGAYDNDEYVENDACEERASKVQGEAPDEVFQKALADVIGDDHDCEERDERSEDQAVNENDEAGFFEIRKLRVLDFAIDLSEGFFSAHSEDGVTESYENGHRAQKPTGLREINSL